MCVCLASFTVTTLLQRFFQQLLYSSLLLLQLLLLLYFFFPPSSHFPDDFKSVSRHFLLFLLLLRGVFCFYSRCQDEDGPLATFQSQLNNCHGMEKGREEREKNKRPTPPSAESAHNQAKAFKKASSPLGGAKKKGKKKKAALAFQDQKRNKARCA